MIKMTEKTTATATPPTDAHVHGEVTHAGRLLATTAAGVFGDSSTRAWKGPSAKVTGVPEVTGVPDERP